MQGMQVRSLGREVRSHMGQPSLCVATMSLPSLEPMLRNGKPLCRDYRETVLQNEDPVQPKNFK